MNVRLKLWAFCYGFPYMCIALVNRLIWACTRTTAHHEVGDEVVDDKPHVH